MNIDRHKSALAEAKKFVSLAQKLLTDAESNKFAFITGSKLSGAVRRQSMELTRALTEMRKP